MAEPETAQEFTALYNDNHRRVYAYAVARAGQPLADEIVAETFLVAWRRFSQMPTGAALPWLLGVARNVIRERYRDEGRQRAVAAEMLAWAADTPDVADGVAERSAVLTALARLSENDREVLTLIAWDGLSRSAAARVLNCSVPAFLVRLHRARNRLERAVAAAEEPAPEKPAAAESRTTKPYLTQPAVLKPAVTKEPSR